MTKINHRYTFKTFNEIDLQEYLIKKIPLVLTEKDEKHE